MQPLLLLLLEYTPLSPSLLPHIPVPPSFPTFPPLPPSFLLLEAPNRTTPTSYHPCTPLPPSLPPSSLPPSLPPSSKLTFCVLITQSLLPHVAKSDGAFAAAVDEEVATAGVELRGRNDLCQLLHVGRLDVHNI